MHFLSDLSDSTFRVVSDCGLYLNQCRATWILTPALLECRSQFAGKLTLKSGLRSGSVRPAALFKTNQNQLSSSLLFKMRG